MGDKCVINYSFKATYTTFKNDDIITLQNLFKSDKLKERLVNGKQTRPSHKFLCSEKGKYTFHVLLIIFVNIFNLINFYLSIFLKLFKLLLILNTQ